MAKINDNVRPEMRFTKVEAYFIAKVTKFGNGAKISCPKKYLGRRVCVVICKK